MQLLHADRERTLSSGQALELTPPDPTGEQALDLLVCEQFPLGLSRHGHRHLLTRTHQLDHIAAGGVPTAQVQDRANAEIELIVELVRRDVAPDAPSRLTSVFACDSAKALRSYASAHGFADGYRVAVLDVDIDDAFLADARWLRQGSPLSMWHLARGYWSQLAVDEEMPQWEFIVELPVTVVEIRPR